MNSCFPEENILSQIKKPGRYIGKEWNICKKDFDSSYIKFGLCFPDLYEIGMSNLGLRIIYGLLNREADVSCERFFSCDKDLENMLRSSGDEIFSLESKRRLGEFDLLGFSLSFELNYTNVLAILELGSVPLKASLRNHNHPLVIAGGPCALNPEPMSDFFDLFIIGEAEDALLELIAKYRKYKKDFRSGKISKEELLILLSEIPGVYAPCLYEVSYLASGSIEKFTPKISTIPAQIKKRKVEDLSRSYFPADWLVPFLEITHDRITLEIMRGCPNTCRFCQARSVYFPFRLRKEEEVLRLAKESYAATGYEELSLAGLSVSDYPNLEGLVQQMVNEFKGRAVGISLPSLKAKALIGRISSLIACIRKTGLTFAPEAGSERLRRMLDKDFDEEVFFQVMEEAYLAGYQRVKLYFMIGLPYESEQDLDALIDFSVKVAELRRKTSNKKAFVNISINTLIPKPHTAMQWFAMEDMESIRKKHSYLKSKVRHRKLALNFHNIEMSFLEAVLSRGDRRLGGVILSAYKKGCRFDAWSDSFIFQNWLDAFQECNIDAGFYLKEKAFNENLPWDFIDFGIDKTALRSEFDKLIANK